MKKEPTEKEIENSILEYLSTQKGYFWKNQSVGIWDNAKKIYRKSFSRFNAVGTADILGLVDGRFVAIEVKSKRGKTTKAQDAFLQVVSDNSGIALVCRSIKDVKEGLECHTGRK